MDKFLLFCLVFLACSEPRAQNIRNLVFEGAGIRGIAYCGAIKELEASGKLKDVQRVAGTSAGAITALALSLGYSAAEIGNLVSRTPIQDFNDGGYFFVGGLVRLKKHFGWYKGKAADAWLGRVISDRTGDPDITFAGLQHRGYKDLFVTGTSLDEQRLVIFSVHHYPQMKVRDAVRISMGIPFYFEPLYMNSSGETTRRPKQKEGWHLMVDGGFLANFPIRIFDISTFTTANETTGAIAYNPQTLGFRIDTKEQVINDSLGKGLAPMPVNNMKEYVNAFYTLVIEGLNRQELAPEDWKRTISIPDGELGPRIRRLKKKEIETLMNNGAAATRSFFSIKQ